MRCSGLVAGGLHWTFLLVVYVPTERELPWTGLGVETVAVSTEQELETPTRDVRQEIDAAAGSATATRAIKDGGGRPTLFLFVAADGVGLGLLGVQCGAGLRIPSQARACHALTSGPDLTENTWGDRLPRSPS